MERWFDDERTLDVHGDELQCRFEVSRRGEVVSAAAARAEVLAHLLGSAATQTSSAVEGGER